MSKIDGQLMRIYEESTKSDSSKGKKVSEEEALRLIRCAEKINSNATGSCFTSSDARGSKHLQRLLKHHKDEFSKESRLVIKDYLQSGHVPVLTTSLSSAQSSSLSEGMSVPIHGRPAGNGHLPIPTFPNTHATPVPPNLGRPSGNGGSMPVPPSLGRPSGNGGSMPVPPSPGRPSGNGGSMPVPPSLGRPSGNGGSMPVPPSPGRPSGNGGSMPVPPSLGRPSGNGGSMPVPPSLGRPSGNGGSMPVPPSPGRPGGNGGSMPAPPSLGRPSGNGGSMPVPPSPGRPSDNGGSMPVPPSAGRPSDNGGSVSVPPSSGHIGGNNPGASVPAVPPNVPPLGVPVSGGVDNHHGVEGPFGVEILNWKADKATEHFHWFPLQETQPNGGDATNNLYAPRGALAKYDTFTGTSKAREYEFEHNRKAVNAGAEFGWWGHCDKAATAACVLQAPKHDVILTNQNGEKVRFTKNDIQGLCVKVVSNLAEKVDFRGNRYNGAAKDDPNDPLPDVFINVMKEWSTDKLPFVLDIDPGTQVWNFPYDQVKIYESTNAPAGFNGANMPNDGSVKYYHIEMMGTGYPEKARVYESFIQTDAHGKTVKSGWIKTPKSHKNPDFMWRPHPVGDLRDKSLWVNHGKVSNPEIDPQIVYDIYMKSLA